MPKKQTKETVKVSTIVASEETLKKVINYPINGKKARGFWKSVSIFIEEVKLFHTLKETYIKENGSADESGTTFSINQTKESIASFQGYINDILMQEVEINTDTKLNDTDLETMKLSAVDFNNLESLKLIEE